MSTFHLGWMYPRGKLLYVKVGITSDNFPCLLATLTKQRKLINAFIFGYDVPFVRDYPPC